MTNSWWLCPPERFYTTAKEEQERMRTQPLPKAVDHFFREQENYEESLLREGYPSSRKRRYKAPNLETKPGKEIPTY